jgi:solute carrier family 35, member E1
MIISAMQLAVCAAYALLLWIIRVNPINLCGLQLPGSQPVPGITAGDVVKTIPLGFCSAAAHSASVFALGGDPLFGQIVKAGEPVMAAAVGLVFYGKGETVTKYLCLPIIVGGVAFASLKKNAEVASFSYLFCCGMCSYVWFLFAQGGYGLKYDKTALVMGMLANGFAAIKGQENSKIMKGPGPCFQKHNIISWMKKLDF